MPLSAAPGAAAALGSLLLGLPLAAGQWGSVGGEDLVICGQWSEKLDDMNEVCCADEPGGQCANGFPSTCSHACAGVFSNFNDDCEGMFSYLGLTDNEDYMTFAALCEDGHEPRGLANADSIGYSNGGLSYSPPAIVQFDVNMDGVDVPDGGLVQVCGTL